MEISGKVAVITGGGSGIGRGIALAIAKAGGDVVIGEIDVERAEAVAKEIGSLGRRAAVFKCDVTLESSVESLADFAWNTMGKVDLIFNNAGVVSVGLAVDASAKDLLWTYNVNVFGVWYGSVVFARRFIDAGIRGWICNTGSESAIGVASIGTAIYTSAKHAVLGMTDTLRSEYAGKIGFSVLCPGIVRTNIWNAGRNRPEALGGTFKGDPVSEKAITFGLSPELVGSHVVESIKNEEFYIFTHPHVRDVAVQRCDEITAAMDRQWPNGAGAGHYATVDVQRKVMEEMGGSSI